MLLHNCVGVGFWENELEKDEGLAYDEGWEDETWEDDGFTIKNIEDLDAPPDDELD